MEILLIILTVLSLGATVTFAVAAWRARADAARRSAARVAALASALAAPHGGSGIGDRGSVANEPGTIELPDPRPPVPDPDNASMFGTIAGARGGPLLGMPAMVTAVAAVLVIGGGMVLRNNPRPGPPAAESAPLELVSMRHERDGRMLTVTGLVRNPTGGTPLAGVAALVFAFDRDGEFVASQRAALDIPVLQPGDESPFVVTLTDLAEVGRYRVSFRTDAGLIRHIDRRPPPRLVTAR